MSCSVCSVQCCVFSVNIWRVKQCGVTMSTVGEGRRLGIVWSSSLYSVYCTLYTVHCVHYTLLNDNGGLYTVHRILYRTQYKLHNIHFTLQTVYFLLFTHFFVIRKVPRLLYFKMCTLHTPCFVTPLSTTLCIVQAQYEHNMLQDKYYLVP